MEERPPFQIEAPFFYFCARIYITLVARVRRFKPIAETIETSMLTLHHPGCQSLRESKDEERGKPRVTLHWYLNGEAIELLKMLSLILADIENSRLVYL